MSSIYKMSNRLLCVFSLSGIAICLLSSTSFSAQITTFTITPTAVNFQFTLDIPSKTSAGVYRLDGKLVKPLWNNVSHPAGTRSGTWDKRDQSGNLVPFNSANRYELKVIHHNVNYVWSGVIGNTSAAQVGKNIHRSSAPPHALAIADSRAFYAVGYNEGQHGMNAFNLNNIQHKLPYLEHDAMSAFTEVATDGNLVYWGSRGGGFAGEAVSFVAGTSVSEQTGYNAFPVGEDVCTWEPDGSFTEGQCHYAGTWRGTLDVENDGPWGTISGLAVQRQGNFLFVARRDRYEIRVFNKTQGNRLKINIVPWPSRLSLGSSLNAQGQVLPDSVLWAVIEEAGQKKVTRFLINPLDGSLVRDLTISSLVRPSDVAASPDGTTVLVTDIGELDPYGSAVNPATGQRYIDPSTGQPYTDFDSAGYIKIRSEARARVIHQVIAFDAKTGVQKWALGQKGGYVLNGPAVTFSKFDFSLHRWAPPCVAYARDGSFWVVDVGNNRMIHYSAARKYIEHIQYQTYSYSVNADIKNPNRVFNEFKEFSVNYAKALGGTNGSWTYVKNWGATLPDQYWGFKNGMYPAVTFPNGKTYAVCIDSTPWEEGGGAKLFELTALGLRFTGYFMWGVLGDDYSQAWQDQAEGVPDGTPIRWTKVSLNGYNAAGDPMWTQADSTVAVVSSAWNDPLEKSGGAGEGGLAITSTARLITYHTGASAGYHLGAVGVGGTSWLWRVAPSTTPDYAGAFPNNGDFDIGNSVQHAGNMRQAVGRNIFAGYHGEMWKWSQANQFLHYYDNGLFLGRFGVHQFDVPPGEAGAGAAGNAFSWKVVQINGKTYLWHNDESNHAGVHRWEVVGLSGIKELSAQIPLTSGPP